MTEPRRILLHVDRTATMPLRFEVAIDLAERFDGQVAAQYAVTPAIVAAPTGLVASPAASSVAAQAMLRLDEDRRQAARAAFERAAAGSGRLHWIEADGDPFDSLTRRARYADLILLGQPDPSGPHAADQPAALIPDLLLHSGRPGLILPRSFSPAPVGTRVLVAWTPSAEATRALALSLPWLQRAQAVDLVSFGDRSRQDLEDCAAYLASHGIESQRRTGPATESVGEYLLSEASDRGSNLRVMGCYGHSRMRERLLGGATRTLLESMTVPVLMVH